LGILADHVGQPALRRDLALALRLRRLLGSHLLL